MTIGATTYAFLWDRDLDATLGTIADAGFRDVELLVSPPHLSVSASSSEVASVGASLERYGLRLSSVNAPTLDANLASTEPGLRAASIEFYRGLLTIGSDLGAPTAVVSPGRVHPLQSPRLDVVRGFAQSSVAELAGFAADREIVLGLETLPYKIFETTDSIAGLIAEVGAPSLGIVLDFANVHGIEDGVAALERHASSIVLVQLSDSTRANWRHDELGTGEIDYARMWPSVVASEKPVVLEITSPADIAAQVRSRAALDRFAQEVSR